MDIKQIENQEELTQALETAIEEKCGAKLFTLRILENDDEKLDVIAITEDKQVMRLEIFIQNIQGKIGIRMRGNFI